MSKHEAMRGVSRLSNQGTEREVRVLQDAGWRPLKEILGGLPLELRISEHTFLKSWRPGRLVPRSIEPRVFRGYGPGRGGTLSLWPPETSRFVRVARELQSYVSPAGRRPRRQASASSHRGQPNLSHGGLRVALWAVGFDYDPELIRETLLEQLIQFGELTKSRGQAMFRSREQTIMEVLSKSDEDALEDLVAGHRGRLAHAGIRPRTARKEIRALILGRKRSRSLLNRIAAAVEAPDADLERMRSDARCLLLFYLSWESWRRQMVQGITPAMPDFEAMGLDQSMLGVEAEYVQLEDAWRHLMHFPILAAYVLYAAKSSDPKSAEWYKVTLPLYSQWTFWEHLPPSVKDVAVREHGR
jgi:hypothetical protein